jgi:hypothetical protein
MSIILEKSTKLSHERLNGNEYISPSLLISQIELFDKKPGSIANIKSTLSQLITLGLLDDDQLFLNLGDNFDLTKIKVKEYITRTGKNKDWPTYLNDIKKAFLIVKTESFADVHKLSFANSLIYFTEKYYGKKKETYELIKLLSEDTEIPIGPLATWFYGKCMPEKSISFERIKVIDSFLNAGNIIYKSCGLAPPTINKSVYRKKALPISESLQKEADQYIAWRKDRLLPEHKSKLVNAIKDRTIRIEDSTINDERWNTNPAGVCSSETAFNTRIRGYFNILSEKLNKDLSEFKFVDLFNHDYINIYINSCRTKQIFTTCSSLLGWIISETKAHSYSSIYLADDESIDHNDWKKYLTAINKFVSLNRGILLEGYKALEGARNVNFILSSDEPFYMTNKIIEGLYFNANSTFSLSKHINDYKFALAFEVLLVCPLRIANIAHLKELGSYSERKALFKFKEDKSIGIYFNETKSSYYLYVHLDNLKNNKSENISDIHIDIGHLSDKYEHLINKRNEFFEKKPEFKSNFIFGFRTKSGSNVETVNSRALASSFKRITKKIIQAYFPDEDSDGINPHAMRHLAASLFLRDNPENFLALATLLMDDIDTVMKKYAHRDDSLYSKKLSAWGATRFGDSHA